MVLHIPVSKQGLIGIGVLMAVRADFRIDEMSKWRRSLSGLVFLAFGAVCTNMVEAAPDDKAYQRVAEKAYQNYILPSFSAFHKASADLQEEIGGFCAKPDPSGLADVKGSFFQLVEHWGAIEFLRFGPLQSKNRLERLMFWPDRKGTALKKVRQAIRKRDAKRLVPGALAQGSVAFQGMTALEFALFGDGSESLLLAGNEQGLYRCQLAHAIAANIEATSGELVKAWGPQQFGKIFVEPGKGNGIYQEPKEVVAELVKAIGTNSQYFTDVKLLPVVGKSAEKARPKKALFRRSGASLVSMQSSLSHVKALVESSGFASLLSEEDKWIYDNALFELQSADLALGKIASIGMPEAITDEKGRETFVYLEGVVRRLGDLIVLEYATAASLVIGFNALDGD